MPPVFDSKKCVKCGRCVKDCPGYILELDKERHRSIQARVLALRQLPHQLPPSGRFL